MPDLKNNVIYVNNYLELQENIVLLSEVKQIIENICKRFYFKRDILFQKV